MFRFLVLLALLVAPSRQQTPISPCPNVFTYEPPGSEPGRWYGVVNLSTDSTLHSVWVNILLDSKADILGNWVGDVSTSDNINFKIENTKMKIHPGPATPVRFFVQYNPLNKAPKVQTIRLNGREICNINTPLPAVERPDNDRRTTKPDIKPEDTPQSKPVHGQPSGTGPVYSSTHNPIPQDPVNLNIGGGPIPAQNVGSQAGTGTQTGSGYRPGTQSGSSFGTGRQPESDYGAGAQSGSESGSGTQTGSNRLSSGTQTGSNFGTGTQSGSSFGTGRQPGSDYGAGTQSGNEAGSGTQTGSNFGTGTQSGSSFGTGRQPGSDYGAGTQSGNEAGSGTQTGSNFGTGTQSGSSFGTGRQPGSDYGAGTQSGNVAGSGTQTGSNFGTGTQSGSSFGTGRQPGSDYGAGTQSGNVAGSGTQTGSNFGTGTQSGSSFNTGTSYSGRPDNGYRLTTAAPMRTTTKYDDEGDFDDKSQYFDGPPPTIILSGGSNNNNNAYGNNNGQTQCGKVFLNNPNPLVVSGRPTLEGQWPWQIALYHTQTVDNKYICGGTLVSRSHVITAAHCVTRKSSNRIVNKNTLTVYLGKHNLRTSVQGVQIRLVDDIRVHPSYNASSYSRDVSVLRLREQARYTDWVQPACLWPDSEIDLSNIIAKKGSVVGWGFDETGVATEELSLVEMPVVDQETCIRSYSEFFVKFTSDYTFCAGYKNGSSVCNGDSGGGMVFYMRNAWYLRGLVSLSVARQNEYRCDPNHYVVFTDLAKFLPWIHQNISDE